MMHSKVQLKSKEQPIGVNPIGWDTFTFHLKKTPIDFGCFTKNSDGFTLNQIVLLAFGYFFQKLKIGCGQKNPFTPTFSAIKIKVGYT